jgi:transcriptional regulator with XRE-family HTH domain
MSFGEKLKKIREEKHLSQEQMSKLLSMEQPNYCKYEKDKLQPPLDVVKRVIDTFNVSFEWLMQNPGPTINFENCNHSVGAVYGDNYSMPKEVVEMILNLHKITTELAEKVLNKK